MLKAQNNGNTKIQQVAQEQATIERRIDMRFWAKLKLEGEQAGRLIREFFVYFNPESSILIKGNEATIEIVFDKSPQMEIIGAITSCDVIDFLYEGTKELPIELAKHVKKEQVETEETHENEEHHQEAPKTRKPRQKRKEKEEQTENVRIPVLDEIANTVHSYGEFIMAISIALDLNSKQEAFFKEVVEIASNLEKISWKRIKEEVESKGKKWYGYGQIQCSQIVTEKFENTDVTIMSLIKAIVQYRTFEFKAHEGKSSGSTLESLDENTTTEHVGTAVEEANIEVHEEETQEVPAEPTQLSRKKIECMPDIPHLEAAIGSVNKTKPIETRVRYVLEHMGLSGRAKSEIQEILSLANEAMNLKDSSEMSELDVSAEAWVSFAELLDDFMNRNGHGGEDEMVRVEDFLSDLQKVILTEKELASL